MTRLSSLLPFVVGCLVLSCKPAAPARTPSQLLAENQWKLADAARQQGDPARSLAAAETAFLFEATPHARELIVARAEAFSRATTTPNESERATLAWQAQELVKDEPDARRRASLLAALGRSHQLTGDVQAAHATLAAAVQAQPTHVGALLLLANDLLAQNQLPMAQAMYERVLAAEPGNRDVLLPYGRLLLQVGDLDKALAFLSGASQLAPTNLDLSLALADAFEARGKHTQAVTLLRNLVGGQTSEGRGLPRDVRLAPVRVRLAELLVDDGEWVDAEAELRQAQADAPGAAVALGLAEVALQQGHTERALAVVERHWDELPPRPRPLYVAAMTLARSGQADQARAAFQQYMRVAMRLPGEAQRLNRLTDAIRALPPTAPAKAPLPAPAKLPAPHP